MRINGKEVNLRSTTLLELPRSSGPSISLKVASIPVGVNRDYEAINPTPLPPMVVTNKAGGKTERERNYEDPKFVQAIEEHTFLRTLYILTRVLECDTNVAFDNANNSVEGLRGIKDELNAAGFSEGDIGKILSTSAAISQITGEDVEKAKENF